MLSGALLKRHIEDLNKQQDIVQKNVENLLTTLEEAKNQKQTQECIHIADKIKTYIDKTPLKILPKKEIYLRQLYELIGLAHLDIYRLNINQEEHEQIKRVHILFGKDISRKPSRDSVIDNCQDGFMDIK